MNLYDIAIAKKLSGGGGGGGGGSSYTLIHQEDIEVSTTSTSAEIVKEISLDPTVFEGKMIYVRIRDKAGPRNDYYFGSDGFLPYKQNMNDTYWGKFGYRTASDAVMRINSNADYQYGVYPSAWIFNGTLKISARYNSNSTKTIDGTFSIEVYALDWPGGVSPFN